MFRTYSRSGLLPMAVPLYAGMDQVADGGLPPLMALKDKAA